MASGRRSRYQKPSVISESLSPPAPNKKPAERHESHVQTQAELTRSAISHLSDDFEPLQLGHSAPGVPDAPVYRQDDSSTVDDEPAVLGRQMGEVISVISKLESLGLRQLRIPLPNCVVLGEQSTGKSSVIEAISCIRTPRATDTCTRCPLYIKMEPCGDPDAPWQATIFIRRSYNYTGSQTGKFPGWNPCAPVITEFAATQNPGELEGLIARAQLAVLSPFNETASFLPPGEPKSTHLMQFSPNVVSIHLTKPGLPALSFYDLPGIIGQTENNDDLYLVKFVRDLVTEYVKDANSLVLLTCSLENDIANSAAGGIARDLKATDRCIGVLTKPDRLPPGSRIDKLGMVLNGSRFKLGHGYYVVKNPGQDGIDKQLSHRQARAEEIAFFQETEPWSSTLCNPYGARFGTQRLQQKLSETLATQMTKSLPTIQEQVNQRLRDINAELEQYPEPPSFNAARVISDIILDFATHARRELEAEYPCREWRNTWESLHEKFYAGLVSMKPTMLTSGDDDKGILAHMNGTAAPGGTRDDALVVDSDEDSVDTMTASPETPSKKRKHEDPDVLPSSAGRFPKSSPNFRVKSAGNKAKAQSAGEYDRYRRRFSLDEVRQYLRDTSKSRLPDQLNPKVIDDMTISTIQHWELPLQKFFEGLQQKLSEQVRAIFDQHFRKWSDSALYQQAWAIVNELLEKNFVQLRDVMAAESLADEREGPYVFNKDMFEREKALLCEVYRTHRYRAREQLYAKELLEGTEKQLTAQEREKIRRDERKRAILEREPYKTEIDVIAQITTYYMLAARRMYEAVCMRIESRFFKRLRTTLRDELESGLGIHDLDKGPQNAMKLLAEPPQRHTRRLELQAMQNALMQGLEMLRDLQRKYGNDRTSSASTFHHDEMEGITASGILD